MPLLYCSGDCGEHWQGPFTHNIPFSDSKIYAGTLANGRNFLIGNLQPGRERLALFLSEKNSMNFTRGFLLRNGYDETLKRVPQWSYPCACACADGALRIIHTMGARTDNNYRGAMLLTVPPEEME